MLERRTTLRTKRTGLYSENKFCKLESAGRKDGRVEVVNLPVVVLKAVDEGKASRDVGDGARVGVCQGDGPHADASCGVAVNLCCQHSVRILFLGLPPLATRS